MSWRRRSALSSRPASRRRIAASSSYAGESSRLIERRAPRFSSSIWISPIPPPTSSTVAPSIPRASRNSAIRRATLSRPRLRYRFAMRRAKRGPKNRSQPRGLQQLAMRSACRAEIGEAEAQDEARERAADLCGAQQRGERRGKRARLRDEEGPQLEPVEAGRAEVVPHLAQVVLTRVQVEDELLLGVARDAPEELAAVAGVVDRAETGRGRNRLGRLELVQVAELDPRAARSRRAHHRLARVDAEVLERPQESREPGVAAREVEDAVAGDEVRAERDDQFGAVAEVRRRVRVLLLAPPLGGARVLGARVPHRRASRRSGCLRRKRAIARACQIVWRVRNRRSITAAYSWCTTAAGTYQRSQPAFAAR